jgi:hypothetical protein
MVKSDILFILCAMNVVSGSEHCTAIKYLISILIEFILNFNKKKTKYGRGFSRNARKNDVRQISPLICPKHHQPAGRYQGVVLCRGGLSKIRLANALGKSGGYDVEFELPKPLHPKFLDPGKPQTPTRLKWKILSLGYFDSKANAGVDVRYTCQNVRLKEEIVLSQKARNDLPDPTQYGIARDNAYLMMAVEFMLTPANLQVFARRQTGKAPVKQGNLFAFEGDDPIDFEDADSTLHFFFAKDFAWAVNDSATNLAGSTSVKRYFYSERGKDYMLVGVPWSWLNAAPAGTLIIDPTVLPAASDDTRLQDTGNYGST